MIVYFNGQYMREENVRISPFDRGFQFADGVYEVVRAYEGRFFRFESHLRRLRHSLDELRIIHPDVEGLRGVADELLDRNGFGGRHCKFYVQVTRGVAPRSHRFPAEPSSPTVFAAISKIDPPSEPETARVILTPDTRWARRDIKSLMLLSNVLASQAAAEAGADEAILVEEGVVTEGSHTGFAAVRDGALYTHPSGRRILPSITREVVLELCAELEIPVRYEGVPVGDISDFSELMILGTTSEVSAVVSVDGSPFDGPGPVTRRLQVAFHEKVRSEVDMPESES